MARYTPEFLARLRAQYEDGDLPVDEVAAEFHISTRTLGRLALRENWDRRSARVRDVPRAMQLLKEAEALAATECAKPEPPGLLEDAKQGASAQDALPASSVIDRLERLVLNEIEGEEARRAHRRERSPAATERGARTLAILTQTVKNLQRLRAGDLTDTDTPERDSSHDDDMPHDIDEFRRDLARRIDAFVASRTNGGDAGGDSDAAPVDEVR